MTEEEQKHALELARTGADRVIFGLAMGAGIKPEHTINDIHEEFFETISEEGVYGMEAWTVFEATDLEGQTYYAHLLGDLDSLIVEAVREHSAILEGE